MMKAISLMICVIILFSCAEKETTERGQEMEFRIDSSYFDFSQKDTFHNFITPHLENWKWDTIQTHPKNEPSFMVANESKHVAVIFSKLPSRKTTSYQYYQKLKEDKSLGNEILNISNYINKGLKLTQLVLKNENQIIFKLVFDNENSADEMDIYIGKDQYTEENILLTESILGQLEFIKN